MEEWELLSQCVDLLSFLRGTEKIRTVQSMENLNDFMNLDSQRLSRINNRILNQNFSTQEILFQAEEILKQCKENHISTVSWGEDDYPQLLSHTSDPPFRLYFRGQPLLRDFEGVAVVGTRLPTWEGEKEAFRLGLELSGSECPVISGLALGIDIEAHRGALAVNGRTIAVLGSGVDMVTPKKNEETAREILLKGGTLISEYPPGTPGAPWRFPARNRIIAGLAQAVIVVQAPRKSGALITSDFALQEGRDVMITPSGLTMEGTSSLAEAGAPVIESAWQILRELNTPPVKESSLLPDPVDREELIRNMKQELNEEIIIHDGNSYRVS